MGFGSPKLPGPDLTLRDLQRRSLEASIESARAASKIPELKVPGPQKLSPPAQQTAADVAAAERLARINMSKKKGIQWSLNPTPGGAGL